MGARVIRSIATVVAVVVAAACADVAAPTARSLSPDGPSLAKAAKITICHAAGRAGTTKYVAITVSANATGGHFHNNGTPKAGHEDDFIADANRTCAPGGTLVICATGENGVVQGHPQAASVEFSLATDLPTTHTLKLTDLGNPCATIADVPAGPVQITEASPTGAFNVWFTRYIESSPAANLLSADPSFAAQWNGFTHRNDSYIATATVQVNSGETVTVTYRQAF